MTRSEIAALENPEEGPFEEKEKAVLALAEHLALTNSPSTMDAALSDRLSAVLEPQEIVELSVVLAVLVGMAKMLFAFDVVDREESCPFHR